MVAAGQCVLLVWGASSSTTNMEEYVNTLRNQTGTEGFVQVENVEMLLQCDYYFIFFDFTKLLKMTVVS